jgi:hypothetical protein
MPRIFRIMKNDGGRPMLGSSSTTLGVRLPGSSSDPDIVPGPDGDVSPGTGGMSVSPSLTDLLERLPPTFIPKRLQPLVPDAAGSNNLTAWRMGQGSFVAAAVTELLALRPDPDEPQHGFVEPASLMALDEYVSALHVTQSAWVVDEEVQEP